MSEDWTKNVSMRVRNLPPYLFGRLNAMRDAKRADGIDILDLGMGSPSDPAPQAVIETLCEKVRDPAMHGYNHPRGMDELRAEVAASYKKLFGVSLDPDTEVIALVGSKEGFSHMCLSLLGPGDTAVVGDPYFPIHVHAIALAGANVIRIPLGSDEAFLDRVAAAVENVYPRPKCIVLNYPHNPTAITVDDVSFFEKAVEIAKKHDVMIMHDFAYGRTCFDGYVAPSFLQASGAKDVGVEFITMSKPYNMAGWRVGFCLGNAEMIRSLATIKGYYDYGVFTAVQHAAVTAMRDCDDTVVGQAKIYASRRDVIVKGLREAGWDVPSPRASMFVWAKVPGRHLAGQSTLDFALRLMDEAEVALSPGAAFGDLGEGYVRVALVESEERLARAARQIDMVLNKGAKAPFA